MEEIIDDDYTRISEVKPLEGRKKFVKYSIYVLIIITLFTYLYKWNMYRDLDLSVSLEQESKIYILFAVLTLIAQIITVIAVCMWFYRANYNLHAVGMKRMDYSSGWSVGWFFIPLANFFMPAKVLAEIYKASHHFWKEDKKRWVNRNFPSIVIFWWLLYIASGIITRISVYVDESIAEKIVSVRDFVLYRDVASQLLFLDLSALFFELLSALLLIKIMQKVQFLQENETNENSNDSDSNQNELEFQNK